MKTVSLDKPGKFRLFETHEPEKISFGEALVRVSKVGICGTDLHAYAGRQPFFEYPRILGHELGVEVLEVDSDVVNVEPGMHCAVEPYLNCSLCRPCQLGRTNCCETLKVLGVHTDGGMRERIVIPANKLHPSSSLGLEQLALVETLGIGAHAVQRASVTAGDQVLVVGVGPIGLGAVLFAQLEGAEVAVIDANEARLDFCRDQFGVECTILVNDETYDNINTHFCGLPSVVFDATGNSRAMQTSFEYVANAGRLVYIGFQQDYISFPNPEFHKREMSIISSRNAVADDFCRIIRWMEQGRIDTNPWITHRLQYENITERFVQLQNPETGVLKAILEF